MENSLKVQVRDYPTVKRYTQMIVARSVRSIQGVVTIANVRMLKKKKKKGDAMDFLLCLFRNKR